MRLLVVLLSCAVVLSGTAILRGQSLADVAKAEAARRKTVQEPAKVYTNDDLKDGGRASAPAPAAASSASGPVATPAEPGKTDGDASAKEAEPKKDEKYWRDRITRARETLARSQVLADALQSRINALTTDFANTDDPARRAVVETNRKTALAELDRTRADIDTQTKAIGDIEEEARKAGVPPGWLR